MGGSSSGPSTGKVPRINRGDDVTTRSNDYRTLQGQASSSYRPEYHHDTQRWRRATEYDDYDQRSQERTGDHQRQLDSDEDYDRRSQEHFEYRQPQSDRDEDYGQKHKYHWRPRKQGGSSYRP